MSFIIIMWGQPHYSTTSSFVQFCVPHHSSAFLLLLSLSIPTHCASKTVLFRSVSMAIHPASHAYQLRQPTNNGPDKPAEIRIKGGHADQQDHLEGANCPRHFKKDSPLRYTKKGEMTPTARPRCLMDRARHCSVEQAAAAIGSSRLPATNFTTYGHSRPNGDATAGLHPVHSSEPLYRRSIRSSGQGILLMTTKTVTLHVHGSVHHQS
jgi:hypothetical protein